MTFDAELVRRARAALAAASVLAEGRTSKLTPQIASGKPESSAPAGDGDDLVQRIVAAFARAQDDDQLRLAIFNAEAMIARARRAPAARPGRQGDGLTGDQRSYALLVDWEGTPAAEVAAWEGVKIAHVRRLRFQNGRDPETGRIVQGRPLTAWASPQERADRVHKLRAENPGLSARAIAGLLGVSHPTVLADLKRSASGAGQFDRRQASEPAA